MPKQPNNSKLRKSRKQTKKDTYNDMSNFISTTESEECQDVTMVDTSDPLLEESLAVDVFENDFEEDTEVHSHSKLHKRSKKAKSTPEQALQRKLKARQRVATETFEQRLKRLKALSEYQRERLRNETPEQRKRRLQILRDNQARRLRNETPEMRERRLNKGRVYCKNLRKKSIDAEINVEEISESNVKRSGRRKINEAEEI